MNDERRLHYGFFALCVNIVFYTLVYINLTIGGGAPSAFILWLAIPKEVYYYYDQFILAPSMIMAWMMAAGVIQLASKLFGGKGTFEDMLSVLGFSISVACLASLLHDLPDTFLGAVGLLDLKEYEIVLNSPTIWRTILWILYGSSFLWFVLLFWKAVRVVQQIRRGPAFVVGLAGYIVYQFIFVIFNR